MKQHNCLECPDHEIRAYDNAVYYCDGHREITQAVICKRQGEVGSYKILPKLVHPRGEKCRYYSGKLLNR